MIYIGEFSDYSIGEKMLFGIEKSHKKLNINYDLYFSHKGETGFYTVNFEEPYINPPCFAKTFDDLSRFLETRKYQMSVSVLGGILPGHKKKIEEIVEWRNKQVRELRNSDNCRSYLEKND